MKENTAISTTQLRGYQTLLALFGHEFSGIECQNLAEKLDGNRSTVYKDLATLREAGLAEQLPNKNWRVSPQIGRAAIKMLNHINETRARADEMVSRYTL